MFVLYVRPTLRPARPITANISKVASSIPFMQKSIVPPVTNSSGTPYWDEGLDGGCPKGLPFGQAKHIPHFRRSSFMIETRQGHSTDPASRLQRLISRPDPV